MDTSSVFTTSGCCKGSRKGSGPRTTTHSSARRQRGTRVTPERRELSPAPHEPQPTPHACSLYPAPTLHLQKTPCRSAFLTPWSSGAPWCHRCCLCWSWAARRALWANEPGTPGSGQRGCTALLPGQPPQFSAPDKPRGTPAPGLQAEHPGCSSTARLQEPSPRITPLIADPPLAQSKLVTLNPRPFGVTLRLGQTH